MPTADQHVELDAAAKAKFDADDTAAKMKLDAETLQATAAARLVKALEPYQSLESLPEGRYVTTPGSHAIIIKTTEGVGVERLPVLADVLKEGATA